MAVPRVTSSAEELQAAVWPRPGLDPLGLAAVGGDKDESVVRAAACATRRRGGFIDDTHTVDIYLGDAGAGGAFPDLGEPAE